MAADRQRIVVGYDGSPEAEQAVAWAVGTARLLEAGIDVVIAVSPMDPVVGDFHRTAVRIAEERRTRAVQVLRSTNWSPTEVRIVRGHTVPVLLEASRAADLLVVGSVGGHRAAARAVGAATGQQLARHASCSVVVARMPGPSRATTILVGVDGSVESIAALRFAIARARVTRERVCATYACPARLVPDRDHESHRHVASHHDIAGRCLHDWVAEARSGDDAVSVVEEVVAGEAAHVLASRSARASLVVVGPRGRDAIAEVLLGSTSQYLLNAAHCSVAVVR